MAKAKLTGYSRRCEEVGPGDWQWKTDGLTWRWCALPGVNLMLVQGEAMTPVVYAKTLAEAGVFSEGFTAGYNSRPAAR